MKWYNKKTEVNIVLLILLIILVFGVFGHTFGQLKTYKNYYNDTIPHSFPIPDEINNIA